MRAAPRIPERLDNIAEIQSSLSEMFTAAALTDFEAETMTADDYAADDNTRPF